MIHAMCDLETLGTRPGCRILSIGVVIFSGLGNDHDHAPDNEFYVEVQLDHQGPLHVDRDTVAWWMKQDPEVRDRLFQRQNEKPTLVQALGSLDQFLRAQAPVDMKGNLDLCLWGNGADFDNAILQTAYAELGLVAPWPFWNNRCYRTLKNLVPSIRAPRVGAEHNALDDARTQANHARLILNHLSERV